MRGGSDAKTYQVDAAKPAGAPPSLPAYRDFFAQTLIEQAARNALIVGITAAMPSGTALDKFQKVYPDRMFDVGIAEQHAVTFAAGLAAAGMKPVCAIYSTFLQRAYDSIIHDVAIQNLPVTFVLVNAGLVGEDGRTHHGIFDIAYLRAIPNMVVMAPKDENELRHMIATAMAHDGPISLRFPRGSGARRAARCGRYGPPDWQGGDAARGRRCRHPRPRRPCADGGRGRRSPRAGRHRGNGRQCPFRQAARRGVHPRSGAARRAVRDD